MKLPYTITDNILRLVAAISELLGEVKASHLYKPPMELRKKNRIKTIQSSLEIEGNTLTEEQITALLNNQRILAPQKDIIEVLNAINVYDRLSAFNPYKSDDLKKAHAILMQDLITDAGKLRRKNVGIVKGKELAHLAPDGSVVKALMNDLFTYLKIDADLLLIKSCVFHYELEFIHPFTDGNGRMGRLWQTVLLMQEYPVFAYLPVERLIKKHQKAYYNALGLSDRLGNSTPFIEFMLKIIRQSLSQLLQTQNRTLSAADRIDLFRETAEKNRFSRKDYLIHYKHISQATASRDLKWAVEQRILQKYGQNRLTEYKYVD